MQFSNHTGYPLFKGAVFDGEQLRALAAGLEANKLLNHTHLLTGGGHRAVEVWRGGQQLGVCVGGGRRGRKAHVLQSLSIPTVWFGEVLHVSHQLATASITLTGYIGSLSLLEAIADLCAVMKSHSPHLTYGERHTATPAASTALPTPLPWTRTSRTAHDCLACPPSAPPPPPYDPSALPPLHPVHGLPSLCLLWSPKCVTRCWAMRGGCTWRGSWRTPTPPTSCRWRPCWCPTSSRRRRSRAAAPLVAWRRRWRRATR